MMVDSIIKFGFFRFELLGVSESVYLTYQKHNKGLRVIMRLIKILENIEKRNQSLKVSNIDKQNGISVEEIIWRQN